MPDRDIDDLLLDLREAASPAGSEAIAEARLVERLDRTFSRSDRSLRGAFRSARRTMLALVAVGGVVTGAAATGAIALAAMPSDSQRTAFAAEAANPTRVAYATVAKSTQTPSRDVKRIFGVLSQRYKDIDPANARGIKAADGTQAWVLPGTARTCFGTENADGTGYTCVSNARAAVGSLFSGTVLDDGTVRAIYLVPDDVVEVATEGRTVKPTNNLAVVTYREGSVVTMTADNGESTALMSD